MSFRSSSAGIRPLATMESPTMTVGMPRILCFITTALPGKEDLTDEWTNPQKVWKLRRYGYYKRKSTSS